MGRNKIIYAGGLKETLKSYIGDKVTDSSIDAYTNSLHNIFKVLNKELSIAPLLDFDNVIKLLTEKGYEYSTLKNKISSIITYLKASNVHDDEILMKYADYIDSLTTKIDKRQRTLEKSKTDSENWVTKAELIEIRDILKKNLNIKNLSFGFLHLYEQYICLTIHIIYPFRNELCDALIIDSKNATPAMKDNPNMNYIVVDMNKKKVKIILEKYKTVKTFKDIVIDVDDETAKEIIKYFIYLSNYKHEHEIINDWFIISKTGEKLTRNNYTVFFQHIFEKFNKKIGTSLVRKIIASSLYDVHEMKRLEKVMGHNLNTQLKYYVKE